MNYNSRTHSDTLLWIFRDKNNLHINREKRNCDIRLFRNDCCRLINSRTIWDGSKWLTASCFLGDFGLEIVLHFTQASHKKACQPSIDHFVCLPLLNEESRLPLLHFNSLQTWENRRQDPLRPHHHLPWVLPYTQNHPTLGQWDPEWHFHHGEGNQLRSAHGDEDTWKHRLCEGTDWTEPPDEHSISCCRPFSPHTAVYEILKKDLMWFKWCSAVGYLTSSQRRTRRRKWSAVRRWLCCTRPMDSCFLPPIC